MRPLLALLSIPIAVLAPRLAEASPAYPGDLQTDLSLTYTPPCTVCHPTGTGTGTATSAFAVAMKAKNLVPLDDPSVATALTALESAKIDSDCDGVLDPEQLKEGRDPSTGVYIDGSGKATPTNKGCGTSSGGTTTPLYGCGAQAQLAAGPTPWQGAATIATIAGLALLRGRRRVARLRKRA
jgi:hypothetical protein